MQTIADEADKIPKLAMQLFDLWLRLVQVMGEFFANIGIWFDRVTAEPLRPPGGKMTWVD